MHQFNEYAKHFFQKEKKRLLEAYPGVTLRRLQEEVRHYTLDDMLDDRDLYIPSRSNPVTHFFNQVKSGVPLPYISGRSFFYKSEFIVNSDVLIPRFETEILVELTVNEVKKRKDSSPVEIVDVGTGSGAIILSVMQDCCHPIKATAVDISENALSVARKNYFHLKYTTPRESTLKFIHGDRLNKVETPQDIIVSNPPYIKEHADREMVNFQVDRYEPHDALYISDEKYEQWFHRFFSRAYQLLKNDGVFLMEGHEKHLVSLANMIKSLGFNQVEVIDDYTGRNRFLVARKSHG